MDPATIAMIAQLALKGGEMLYDAFKSKPKNPTQKAEPWLEKAGDIYKPWIQQGQEAYDVRNPIFNQRVQDPTGQYNQLMSGYQESPGYQRRRENALTAAGNSAAAGGMRGSLQDMTNESSIADALLQGDMGDWYKNVLGMQNSGLEGLGDVYNKGYGAASDLANNYGNRGNLELLSQMFQNQKMQGSQNNFMKSLGDLGGQLAGFDWSSLFKSAPKGDVFLPRQSNVNMGIDYSTPKIEPWQYLGMGR